MEPKDNNSNLPPPPETPNIPQVPQPPVPIQPLPSEPPKPKNKLLPILLIIFLAVLALGAFGYLLYQKYQGGNYAPGGISTPLPSQTPSTVSMVQGNTIAAAGFTLRIPDGWKISISSKSSDFFAGRLYIPKTDQSTVYVEIQVGNSGDFVNNPTLTYIGDPVKSGALTIKAGKENLLQSQRVFYQVEKIQAIKKLQITLYGSQNIIDTYKSDINNIAEPATQSSLFKMPGLIGLVKAQESSPSSTPVTQTIAGFSKDLWKQIEIMGGPYPERIVKTDSPYKDGYAKLYKFDYLVGQRIEILAEENTDDVKATGSFIESELYNGNGALVLKGATRLSLESKLNESGTYYLLVRSFSNREGRFLLQVFDLDQVQDLYSVRYADGSEYSINNPVASQSKKQPAVLIVRYTSPIEIVSNNSIRYFRKHDNSCIACNSYIFGDKTIPYVFMVNGVEVPVKITKLFLNQALIQPLESESFPANSQISFDIDYGPDPNIPGSRNGYAGGFKTY